MAYGKIDIDRVKKDNEGFTKRVFWRPDQGKNRIRILPPWGENIKTFYYKYKAHFGIGPDSKKVFCTGQDCFICEKVDELFEAGDTEKGKDLAGKVRIVYNILDLNNPEAGVQVFESGSKIFSSIVDYISDPEWGDITDPQKGYDVIIEKIGEGKFSTEYKVRVAKEPSAISDISVLDNLVDLETLAFKLDRTEQEAIWNGESLDNKDDSNEVTESKPSKKEVKESHTEGSKEEPKRVAKTSEKPESTSNGNKKTPPCFGKYIEGDGICSACKNWNKECYKASLQK